MQVLQLPFGIIEGVAQGKIYIFMSCAIGMKTVGVNLRTGHAQVNLDEVGCTAVATITRAFERDATLHDPLAEPPQSRP